MTAQPPQIEVQHASATHVGRRKSNQDALCEVPDLGLFVVADGMGGYAGGELAAALTIAAISEFFRREADDPEATWPFALDRRLSFAENLIDVAVRVAHKRVVAHRTGINQHMGSTVVALTLREGRAVLAHVGDSRIYRLRGDRLEQLTRDHSLYAEMQAAGMPNLPPRAQFPHANVITRALGMPEARPDVRAEPLQPGDLFLLCTDGLYDVLEEDALTAALARADGSLQRCCDELVQGAYEAGSRDNITAILARMTDP